MTDRELGRRSIGTYIPMKEKAGDNIPQWIMVYGVVALQYGISLRKTFGKRENSRKSGRNNEDASPALQVWYNQTNLLKMHNFLFKICSDRLTGRPSWLEYCNYLFVNERTNKYKANSIVLPFFCMHIQKACYFHLQHSRKMVVTALRLCFK